MQLLFIRHAASVGNLERRMQGQADFELSRQGEHQAMKLAQRLQMEAWLPSHVYSSPLRRASQTAQILLNHCYAPEAKGTVKFEQMAELQELQNGIFQGLTWQEARVRYPALCHALETTPESLPIPGAESLQSARDRAQAFVQTLFAQHANPDRVWIVTHGGILQFLIAELLGCDRVWGLEIQATALFEFSLDFSRWEIEDENRFNTALWQIHRFNDTQHLAA